MLQVLRHWPAVCEVCARWPSQPICAHCRVRHAPRLPRCPGCALALAPGLTLCMQCSENPDRALDLCLARVDYGFPWVEAIHRFKFQQQPAWARPLAALMLEDDTHRPMLEAVALACPVPLAPNRLRERGYNQAWELVKGLHRQAFPHARTLPDMLLRSETAQAQHTLPRAARFAHARHAFSLHPRQGAAVRDAHVLLVDDVMTTGATLQAAAQVLKQAGARHVSAWVFARTAPELDME